MLNDMEHSKKNLEEELQKTSEVNVGTSCKTRPVAVRFLYSVTSNRDHEGVQSEHNILLSFAESVFDRGGEHPSEESSTGGRGRGGAAAGQHR